MALEGFDDLRKLNPYLELNVTHIARGSFEYRCTEVFPVNIISMALNTDRKTFVRNVETGEEYPNEEGVVRLVPCGLPVRHEVTPASVFIALHFNLTFFHGIDLFAGVRTIHRRHDPARVARVHALLDEPDRLKAICALKTEVLGFCLDCWPEEGRRQSLAQAREYEPLFRYVHEHNDATLTVAALAAWAGRRQDCFSRAFSRDLGCSPKAFLQDDLVKKIISRLLRPRVQLKQIADELKFGDQFYLSRFFRRHTGISPSDYQAKFRP
ncbi:MAG: helix-turn-helix domain-containing protein [Lentisphaeria bacterium]|jgi:AraC-like DNA-binding protein|nr:helix-turn-helix domain-containing protein [Lentisphaeria bacterium]